MLNDTIFNLSKKYTHFLKEEIVVSMIYILIMAYNGHILIIPCRYTGGGNLLYGLLSDTKMKPKEFSNF